MKKSQFTEESITYALHQHEGGMNVAGVTHRLLPDIIFPQKGQ